MKSGFWLLTLCMVCVFTSSIHADGTVTPKSDQSSRSVQDPEDPDEDIDDDTETDQDVIIMEEDEDSDSINN